MVRPAVFSDLEELRPLFEHVHAQSPLSEMPIDWGHVRRMFAVATAAPAFHVEVVEHRGRLVGCLAGLITPNMMGAKIAVDLFVFSWRETDQLVRRFCRWAKANGAQAVSLTNLSGRVRYDRLIERSGLRPIGSTFLEVF